MTLSSSLMAKFGSKILSSCNMVLRLLLKFRDESLIQTNLAEQFIPMLGAEIQPLGQLGAGPAALLQHRFDQIPGGRGPVGVEAGIGGGGGGFQPWLSSISRRRTLFTRCQICGPQARNPPPFRPVLLQTPQGGSPQGFKLSALQPPSRRQRRRWCGRTPSSNSSTCSRAMCSS